MVYKFINNEKYCKVEWNSFIIIKNLYSEMYTLFADYLASLMNENNFFHTMY